MTNKSNLSLSFASEISISKKKQNTRKIKKNIRKNSSFNSEKEYEISRSAKDKALTYFKIRTDSSRTISHRRDFKQDCIIKKAIRIRNYTKMRK